jgi:hypothetical protein
MKPTDSRSRDRTMRDSLFLLTAILSVIGSVARDYAGLPGWYKYLSGTFILVSLIVLLVQFVWPWVVGAVTERAGRWRANRIAKELFPSFREVVRHFQDLVNTQSDANLARYLEILRAQEPDLRTKLPNAPPLQYLADFLGMLLDRIDRWDGTYWELKVLGRDLYTFIHQYDRLYAQAPLAELRLLKAGELPDRHRRKIDLLRENYAAFLRQYMTFAKKANGRFGEPAFVDYLDLPEPIWGGTT